MSAPSIKLSDSERERQQCMSEMTAENGPDWAEQYKPGSFGCHELLDRVMLLGDLVEGQVLEHPSCALQPEWYHLAAEAVEALRELYQRIGREHLA